MIINIPLYQVDLTALMLSVLFNKYGYFKTPFYISYIYIYIYIYIYCIYLIWQVLFSVLLDGNTHRSVLVVATFALYRSLLYFFVGWDMLSTC